MVSQKEKRLADASFRLLHLISTRPELSTRKIAEKLGVSNGYAYYILMALIEKGFVKLDNFKSSKTKKQYVYLLTPKGIREKSVLTIGFIKRKKREFEELRKEIDALERETKLSTKIKS